jgi:putative membrane protein
MWLKALHLFFMTAWFAGLFYLPRLFVYHAMTDDEAGNERFKIMERKLYYFVTPWMILTLVFGLWMIHEYQHVRVYLEQMWWLQIKILLVALLVIYHLWCGSIMKTFARDENSRSHKWYRWFNEIPVVILLAIIYLASLKPF